VTHYVIESYILKADLLHSLLKIGIIQYFKRISIYKEHGIALDLGVPRLHKALVARLLPPFVPIESEVLDSFHLILPFL
jgi:hypothetical protein